MGFILNLYASVERVPVAGYTRVCGSLGSGIDWCSSKGRCNGECERTVLLPQ